MTVRKKIDTGDGNATPIRTVQRERCVAMLITLAPIKEIASELCIKPHTIYKWMSEPAFRKELDKQLAIIKNATTQFAIELIQPCFETIKQAIADGDAKIALSLLDKLGSLRSAGSSAGFEQAEISNIPKITINISGHQTPDNTANVIDVEAEKS